MSETADSPPVFGPVMSPEIFRDKWATKIQNLLKYQLLQNAAGSDPFLIFDFYQSGITHLSHFYSQATELGLGHGDFPRPKSVAPDESFQETTMAFLAGSHNCNPFSGAAALLQVIDTKLRHFQQVKEKGVKMHGKSWQELPYRIRQKINDMLEAVEAAREMGWWSVSAEEQRTG